MIFLIALGWLAVTVRLVIGSRRVFALAEKLDYYHDDWQITSARVDQAAYEVLLLFPFWLVGGFILALAAAT